jgi:hypothetical protein
MRSPKRNLFYYLNQKNLILELKQYGHVLSLKELFYSYLKMVLLGIVAAYLFKLPLYGYIIIVTVSLILVPGQILCFYRSIHEQRKFSDISLYIEKMLYYFGKSKEIYTSLLDVIKAFPEGKIHQSIDEAIEIIEKGNQSDFKQNALKCIEKEFPNSRVRTLHNFMLNVEEGGDAQLGVDMLLEDRNLWTSRTIFYQREKQFIQKNVVIAIILTFGLCLTTLYLPSFIKGMEIIDISENIIVQWSAIVLIIFLFYFYTKTNKKLNNNWVEYDLLQNGEKIEKQYEEFIKIDLKKEKTKSYIYAAACSVITLIFFLIIKSKIVLLVGVPLIFFFLKVYKIGYKIEKKNIGKQISKAFPMWLLNIALLKQGKKGSVISAIVNSYSTAPPILKPAIKRMLNELNEDATSAEPFNNFLSEFSISEVREAMSTLYGISEGSGGDIEKEFREIIKKTNKYLDQEEKQKNEDRQALMDTYIMGPALMGSFKLIVDMLVLLLSFMSSTGSIIN